MLCVDPGETTGWSVFVDWELEAFGQDDLWPFLEGLAHALDVWPDDRLPPRQDTLTLAATIGRLDRIVCEDWALYPWKARKGDLDWDKCRTARGIGAVELIARMADLPITLQAAEIKDTAVAAGAEELFLAPRHENRHMNDSIMHGVYFRVAGEGRGLE